MTAIDSFNQVTNQHKENSPIQTEALDLLMSSSKGAGCARPEPNILDFEAIGQGGGGAKGPSTPGNDQVDGKKIDTDDESVTHHKDQGCALPSNPDLLNFDDLGGGGGGAKGPGNDSYVDGKNVDDDNQTVRHHNPYVPFELEDPVRKVPPHELDGVCFTPNFNKPKTQPPRMRDFPAPAWAPISTKS